MSPAEEPGTAPPAGGFWSDVGHTALDIAGFVPVWGEAADVTNAAWYATEGDYLSAGLSLISCIPIVGDVIGKGGKAARKLGPKAQKAVLQAVAKLNIPKFLEPFRSNKRLAPHVDKIIQALQRWQMDMARESADKVARAMATPCAGFKTTSGAALVANPDKTTTVLGSFAQDMDTIVNKQLKLNRNVDFGPKPGGFNVLNVPDEMFLGAEHFWDNVNRPFLDQAIARGDDILLATKPTNAVLVRADGELSGFGKEFKHLLDAGYHYDPLTSRMIKP